MTTNRIMLNCVTKTSLIIESVQENNVINRAQYDCKLKQQKDLCIAENFHQDFLSNYSSCDILLVVTPHGITMVFRRNIHLHQIC